MTIVKTLAGLALAACASISQAALINTVVTANVNPFQQGPYDSLDPISVSFQWESGVSRDWGTSSASYFETAVKNIVINVDGHIITGTDAQLVQRDNTLDDQIAINFGTRLGSTHGTVTSAPDINGQSFEALSIVFRDASNGLFPGSAGYDTLIGAASPNLYVDSLSIYYTGNDIILPYNRDFTMAEAVSTPVMSMIPLFGLGMVVLLARRRS
ncbi:MAG: MYXO-CTERM sorting domain-containing protein [Gammaproteobacteria bacterium]